MISKKSQVFLLLTGICTAFLCLFPFQEDKLVFRRLDTEFRRFERANRGLWEDRCRTISPKTPGVLANLMAKRLVNTLRSGGSEICYLEAQETSTSRFNLSTRKVILVTLSKESQSTPLVQEPFSVPYPRPLCFIPIVVFFLSMILKRNIWGLGLSFGLYVLLLYNFNLLEAIRQTINLSELVISTDKTWLGFTLLTFFLILAREEMAKKDPVRQRLSQAEDTLNRSLLGAIGLWNPAFFTQIYSVFFRSHSLKRLYYYFDAQLLIAVLSLYLFSLKDKFSLEGIRQSLFLPRYFTFALCLGLFVTYGGYRHIKKIPVWVLPGFRRHLLAVLVMELAAFFWKPLTLFPTLTRVSFALLLSQITLTSTIRWRVFLNDCRQPLAWIFLSALVSMMSVELGVVDLALTLFEPQAHPSVLTVFTYLSGIFIGILTGSFSTTFFALVPAILKNQANPIVRAALLDGILAGSLLSPFSLFTLLPVAMLKVPLIDVVRHRMEKLALPLLVGGIVYSLSAFNSVAILRPVTFIFLCLVIVVFKLHRNDWKTGKIWPWEVHFPISKDRSAST